EQDCRHLGRRSRVPPRILLTREFRHEHDIVLPSARANPALCCKLLIHAHTNSQSLVAQLGLLDGCLQNQPFALCSHLSPCFERSTLVVAAPSRCSPCAKSSTHLVFPG